MMTSRTPVRFVPLAILGAFLLMLVGAGNASAEYVTNVDCGSDQEMVDAIKECFKKLTNCPEENKVASECRNNKQYCGCSKKKGGKKDKDEGEDKAKKQEEKAENKAEKQQEKATRRP